MLTFPTLSTPLSDLHELMRPVEPVASVYLGPPVDGFPDPDRERILRRRGIAKHLAEQGAPNPTIDAVVGHLARIPAMHADYAVFARNGRIVLTQAMPGAVSHLAAYSAPPKLGPLLAWHRSQEHDEPWSLVDIAGARPTILALAEDRVRRLLIADDPGIRRFGWFGHDLLCAVDEPESGIRYPYAQRGNLIDIAIRAAVLNGAAVTVLTAAEGRHLPDGMAALLKL